MGEVKWIKVSTDMFNSNRKIKQIELMPEGDTILVIWLKLLLLAGNINDGGAIYLTPEIPYTEEMLANELGRPLFTFSPEEYGENYTKKTDIWGYFNIPKKKPYKLSPDEQLLSSRNNRVLPELPEGYVVPKGWRAQAARRSMTSPKFAEAFYRANK